MTNREKPQNQNKTILLCVFLGVCRFVLFNQFRVILLLEVSSHGKVVKPRTELPSYDTIDPRIHYMWRPNISLKVQRFSSHSGPLSLSSFQGWGIIEGRSYHD